MIVTLPEVIATLSDGCGHHRKIHVCSDCNVEIIHVLEELEKGMKLTKEMTEKLDERIETLDKILKDTLERSGVL